MPTCSTISRLTILSNLPADVAVVADLHLGEAPRTPYFLMRSVPKSTCSCASVTPSVLAPKSRAARATNVPQPQPMSSSGLALLELQLLAAAIDLLVLRVLERHRRASRTTRPCRPSTRRETSRRSRCRGCSARRRCGCPAGVEWIAISGKKFVTRPLHVRLRQRETKEVVPRTRTGRPSSPRNVDAPFDVRVVELGHGHALAAPRLREPGVVEREEVGDIPWDPPRVRLHGRRHAAVYLWLYR